MRVNGCWKAFSRTKTSTMMSLQTTFYSIFIGIFTKFLQKWSKMESEETPWWKFQCAKKLFNSHWPSKFMFASFLEVIPFYWQSKREHHVMSQSHFKTAKVKSCRFLIKFLCFTPYLEKFCLKSYKNGVKRSLKRHHGGSFSARKSFSIAIDPHCLCLQAFSRSYLSKLQTRASCDVLITF